MLTKYQVCFISVYVAASVATVILYRNHLRRMEKKMK